MLQYQAIKHQTKLLKSLTGLSVSAFERLLAEFEPAWEDYIQTTFIRDKPRARSYGGGRHPTLYELADKLLFILVYFHLYPTQQVQGQLFGIGQPQANEWVRKLTPVLEQAQGEEFDLPDRSPYRWEELLQACPGLQDWLERSPQ